MDETDTQETTLTLSVTNKQHFNMVSITSTFERDLERD